MKPNEYTMRKLITTCASIALLLPAFNGNLTAQEENLVPNGSFENGDIKKLKAYGQLEDITTDWFPYTDAPLDLYSTDVKSEKVAVPANSYGYEDASDGVRYAGFRAHTKSPKLARTYFQVRLTDNLAENQLYCVSFDISLSDLSKYAVNGIGAYFSDRKEMQSNLGIVTRTLNNFEFDVLTSDVDYNEQGDLKLQMRLTGTNPDVDPLQPVVLNLGIENNVPQMLRSLQATRSIEEIVERNLGQ